MAVDINSIKYIPDLPPAKPLAAANLLHLNQASVDVQVTLELIAQFINDRNRPIGSLIEYGDKNKDPNVDFPGQTWVRLQSGYSLRTAEANDSNTGTLGGSDEVAVGVQNLPLHDHDLAGAKASMAGQHGHNARSSDAGGHDHNGSSVNAGGGHTHQSVMQGAGGHDHEYAGDDQLTNAGAIFSRQIGRWYDAHSDQHIQSSLYRVTWVGDHAHALTIYGVGDHTHGLAISWGGVHQHTITVDQNGNHEHNLTGKTRGTGGGAKLNVLNRVVFVAVWKRTK